MSAPAVLSRPSPSTRMPTPLGTPAEATRAAALALLWVLVLTIPTASMTMLGEQTGTVSRAVGLVAAPAGLLAVALGGRRRRWLDAHVLLVALVGWSVCSLLWSLDPAATQERALTLLQLLVMVLLIWELADERGRWRALLWAYLLGSAWASVQLLIAVAAGAELTTGRFSTGGFNPNDLVQVLALSMPVAGYLGLTATTLLRRAAAWTHLPLATFAVLATGSRQGLLLLPLGLLIAPLALSRISARARLIAAALLLAVGASLLVQLPDATLDRLRTAPESIADGELGGRGTLWDGALGVLAERPVQGVGQGALERVMGREVGVRLGAHNTFLSVGAELGVMGLGLLVLALLAAFAPIRHYPSNERLLGIALAVVLLASLMPGHNEYDKATWLAIAFIVAPAGARPDLWTVRERLRRAVRPPVLATSRSRP